MDGVLGLLLKGQYKMHHCICMHVRTDDEASYKCITQMIYIPDMALNGENENVIIFHACLWKCQAYMYPQRGMKVHSTHIDCIDKGERA